MKRIIVAAIVLTLSPLAMAQLYKYVDKDGKTVYSDTPPEKGDSKQIRVQTAPPAPAAAPAKSAVEQDKELEKARKKGKEEAKKAEDKEANAQAQEERCAGARNNYAIYLEGTRLMKRTPSGERVFMEEAEIATEKEKARIEMEKACKKG